MISFIVMFDGWGLGSVALTFCGRTVGGRSGGPGERLDTRLVGHVTHFDS